MNKIIISIILILSIQTVYSQKKYHTNSKKAIKQFEKALEFYQINNISKANFYINKAIEKDPNFLEAYLLLADISNSQNNIIDEEKYLIQAYHIDSKNEDALYFLANLYFNKNEYKRALKYFNELFKLNNIDEKIKKKSFLNKKLCEFRLKALKNPVSFQPQNLGKNINTIYDEYFPSLTADDEYIYYTIKIPTNNSMVTSGFQEDIYASRKNKTGKWQQAKSLGAKINSNGNEGAPAISPDGNILFFTNCTCEDGLIRCCDLYFSILQNNEWSQPYKIPEPVNSKYWESQPCFSSDGKTLYFVSNRPGGKGKMDIWKSEVLPSGKWSNPLNLGDSINTEGNEMTPFIHPDNQTLYFSSDRWYGMGGMDIFISRKKDENNNWKKPENIGYPINTYKDETRLIVNTKGNKAYFASNIDSTKGYDIFSFDLPKSISPQRVIFVKGIVYDEENMKLLSSNVELMDLEGEKIIQKTATEVGFGNFLICLSEKNNYGLNINAKGYLFHSENFSLNDLPDSIYSYYMDIPLKKIKSGQKIILKNIFFETDSYKLKKESFVELSKLLQFLNNNPKVKVEIGGHTDNIGGAKYNQTLSENRAKSVVNYLFEKGISKKRLRFKGYGLTQPIADNNTKQGRAKNRRTEFKIIE